MKEYDIEELYQKVDRAFSEREGGLSLEDNIGFCLLYLDRYNKTHDSNTYDKMALACKSVFSGITTFSSIPAFTATNVLWLIEILQKNSVLEVESSEADNVNLYLTNTIFQQLNSNNWDFYHGALGNARLSNNDNVATGIVNYFMENIVIDEKWGYAVKSIYYASPSTNLGFHAGILGILLYTNRLINKGVEIERCKIIQERVLTIIKTIFQKTNYRYYPAIYEYGQCRMCLCYGELILAYSLFDAASVSKNPELCDLAYCLIKLVEERSDLQKAMINDFCVLYGAAGNYFLLSEIRKRFINDERINRLCDIWFGYSINRVYSQSFMHFNRYTQLYEYSYSLLEGLTGVYFALDKNSEWLHSYLFA